MKGHQRLKAVQGLTPVHEAVDEKEFREAAERAQGKLVAWTIGGVMGINSLLYDLDIGVVTTYDLSRIAAWKGVAGKLVAVAEGAGYSQEICGYHRVPIGYALLLARGQLELVPEFPPLPRPDFIWAVNSCPANLGVGEALGWIFDVPVMGPDLAFEYDVANKEENLDYVESQLREQVDILETWVGRPVDWPRLAEHIRGLLQVLDIRNEVNQMFKTCRPSVCSMLDLAPASYAYRSAPIEEGKRIYRALREEIQGKIERGERDVPEEKLRLVWQGVFPWGKQGAIRELLARHGATICSTFITVGSPTERREGLDPGNPLRTVAQMLDIAPAKKSVDMHIEEWDKPSVEGYDVDGIIYCRARTCKIFSIPVDVYAAKVEKELGVPTLIVDADPIDPEFYYQAQMENRIDSFLENIAARKAGV